ncbi:TetR/AcrR family transcriptional regulator [Caballeronia insecticola]|uniref:Transcriptional regulator TetR family n=1 Tax=Caballeronia insecticola TaxID=758793 RepID=A0A060PKS7_9BURK|nr:TetR/AcrR family transcriptional regulator [Caballeronia insecticola]BAO94171.1 transcriptional regulator TetR family [Caballeronia insecticola]
MGHRASSIQGEPASSRRAPTAGIDARQHLLLAADDLFYEEGVRSVGIDAIVERAGVNKMSLYRQFSSKDDLMLAYLDMRNERVFERLEESIGKHPGEPARQIQQYIEDLARRASQACFRGCPFVNVSTEFPNPSHPARAVALEHKMRLITRLAELCTQAGVQEPYALANALALLIEGIYASSQTYGAGGGPVMAAPLVARQLISQACNHPEKNQGLASSSKTSRPVEPGSERIPQDSARSC